MTFRTMLLTAAIVLPLAFDSTPVVAQGRGAERSAVATTQSQPQANGNGEEQRQDQAPPGVMRRFAAGLIDVLPAGIVRRFGAPAPEPEPTPEPAPAPEPEPAPEPVPECVPTFGYDQNGVPGTYCGDVFTPLAGFPG
jgi:hypothetical protein